MTESGDPTNGGLNRDWGSSTNTPSPPPSGMDPAMRKRLGYIARGVFLVVTAIICVTGTIWVINDLFNNGPQSETPIITTPQVEKQKPVTQTDLQKAESAFGPFTALQVPTSDRPDTRMPAVLELRHDGSLAASTKYTVPFDGVSWAPQSELIDINALTLNGEYVQIRSATGKVYTVHTNQPLLSEEYPQHLVLVDSKGQLWLIPSDKAQLARKPLDS